MKKIIIIAVAIVLLAVLAGALFFRAPSKRIDKLTLPTGNTKQQVEPSNTFIDYQDPAGFSFSYPDNLSIEKNEVEDPNLYADLQLFSKDVNGSIKVRIEDTKLASTDIWLESLKLSPAPEKKARKLGNLEGIEIKTADRIILASIDQKILFTVEMPLLEEKFWGKVYEKVVSEFSFSAPDTVSGSSSDYNASGNEVVFEGEDVVE